MIDEAVRRVSARYGHEPAPPPYLPEWEFITPSRAQDYLETNHDRNRAERKAWIVALARTIKEGDYIPTHQGIAFDEDGRLVDGQHRLEAIRMAGSGQWVLVTRGLPLEAIQAIDLHARRHPHDQIRMIDPDINPTTHDVSIARAMSIGGAFVHADAPTYLATTARVHSFLATHWDAIRFAQRHRTASRTRSAPVRAAVARAYYHLDHGRLLDFLRVLDTQLADSPRDHAAVNFHRWCCSDENRHLLNGGSSARATVYRYAAESIRAFFKGQKGTRLAPPEPYTEPFPLPDEP